MATLLPLVKADVMITDPPYGISYLSGRTSRGKRIAGDDTTETRDTCLDLWGGRPAIMFGKWSLPRPVGTKHRLIWSKHPSPGMGDLKSPWGVSDEEIYILGDTSFFSHETRVSNVLTYPTIRTGISRSQVLQRNHPTPKPVSLMTHLVERVPRSAVIVDPFTGSGATLIAAKQTGRTVVGIEIDETYCDIAATLCGQETLF